MSFRSWSRFLAASLVICLSTLTTRAQTSDKFGPKYDTTQEVKLKGTVSEVREPSTPTGPVVLVVLAADKSSTVVRLAPHDYLREIDCWIKVGDVVEVTGAKVTDSTNEIMAREVVFGNNTMVLRDNKGIPIWQSWKPPKPGG
jgi:hypothetical protein